MSTRRALVLTGLAALAACGRGDTSREVAVTDSLSHELEIAPSDTAAAAPIRAKETRSGATPMARKRTAATKPPAAHVQRSRLSEPKASSPSKVTMIEADALGRGGYGSRASTVSTRRWVSSGGRACLMSA